VQIEAVAANLWRWQQIGGKAVARTANWAGSVDVSGLHSRREAGCGTAVVMRRLSGGPLFQTQQFCNTITRAGEFCDILIIKATFLW